MTFNTQKMSNMTENCSIDWSAYKLLYQTARKNGLCSYSWFRKFSFDKVSIHHLLWAEIRLSLRPELHLGGEKKENPQASRKPRFVMQDDNISVCNLVQNSFKVSPHDQSWFHVVVS